MSFFKYIDTTIIPSDATRVLDGLDRVSECADSPQCGVSRETIDKVSEACDRRPPFKPDGTPFECVAYARRFVRWQPCSHC